MQRRAGSPTPALVAATPVTTTLVAPALVATTLIATALIAAATVAATLIATALVAATRCLATLAADLGHVLTILAHGLSSPAAGFAGFLGIELMGSPLLMSGLSALAGDLTLPRLIHSGESPVAIAAIATVATAVPTVAAISLRLSHDAVPQSIVVHQLDIEPSYPAQ
jgi:hypothetical protein